jgi:hypothetical protein
LGTYRVTDNISVSGGVANTVGPTINGKANPPKAESYKTYMGSIAVTAPDDWGFLAGSTMYGGIVNGFSSSYGGSQTSYYLGTTLATPVTGLRLGAAFDLLNVHSPAAVDGGETWAVSMYASFQATEKLSFHGRAEYLRDRGNQQFFGSGAAQKVLAMTATAQYDLWENVLTRLEFRWDHAADGTQPYGGPSTFGSPSLKNAYLLAANVIYKF